MERGQVLFIDIHLLLSKTDLEESEWNKANSKNLHPPATQTPIS